MIQDLLSGVYRPYVSKNTRRCTVNPNIYRNKEVQCHENLLSSGVTEQESIKLETSLVRETDGGNTEDDGQPRDSGEIPVEGFTDVELEEVEEDMKSH